MKPFLKWVGGKTQILEDVLALFPRQIRDYYEPFVGGGSVLLGFLALVKAGRIQCTGTVYASDLNANLIGLYRNIQSQPAAVIQEVKRLSEEYSQATGTAVNRAPQTLEEAKTSPESYYFWVRSRFNALTPAERSAPAGSAMFLFLNKTCFRGLYREGPRGFNVPYGNYKNPSILEEDHIRAVSELIQGVVFSVSSFADPLVRAAAGDFVYLDPPYAPETGTSFVAYTADGFGDSQHTALFGLCAGLSVKGVKFLMSNAAVQSVKDAFPAPVYTTTVIEARRAIHSKKPGAKTQEVLIRN
jgi:DNA adenine methylase